MKDLPAILLLLAVILGPPICAVAVCPSADLTGDCVVGFGDLASMADQWLAPPESPADLNLDDEVDFRDFFELTSQWAHKGISVVINETLAINLDTATKRSYSYYDSWRDPQLEFEDWIELYNFGSEPVDVGGMYLTDDLSQPTLWRIPDDVPSETTIAPGGYLMIWADNETEDFGLHAGFELSADGEDLAMFAADGSTLVDSASLPEQAADISYGRATDANEPWSYLSQPTPGRANKGAYVDVVADTKFDPDRGFYSEPFTVTLSTETVGATIYYTLDGTEPYDTSVRPPGGLIYNGPITISKTTILRARAIKAGYMPTNIDTHTYIFVSDVVEQSKYGQLPGSGWPGDREINYQSMNYGMDPDIVESSAYSAQMEDALLQVPSISLVTKLKDLFDPDTGIYVNAGGHGRAWERPVSAELINPDGTRGFQVNAGLRIRGGYSRSSSNPKHAFRLLFRGEYGDSKLEYPLFGDEGVDEFENMDLRTSQNYSWSFDGSSRNTMVREVFSRDTQGLMGRPYTRSRYYHLYLNGQYWGLFMTQERSEASFAESYFGGDKDDYDVVKVAANNGYIVEPTDGDPAMGAFKRLWEACNAGFYSNSAYFRVQGLNIDGTRNPAYERLVDVDNLIDYMLCTFYVCDYDAPISRFLSNNRPNNFYGIYNREDPDGFKWFRHDAEHSLIDRGDGWLPDRTGPYPAGSEFRYFNPQWLHQRLAENAEYRIRFADRARKHLFDGGLLTPNASTERILDRAHQIDLAIIAESARWGDSKVSYPYNKDDHWWPEIQRILTDYGDWGIPRRTDLLLDQLRSHSWYPSVAAPSFSLYGGRVDPGFTLTMGAPSGTIWYTLDGSDPRLVGGSRNPSAIEYVGGGSGSRTVIAAEDATKRVLVPTQEIEGEWTGQRSYDDSWWDLCAGSPGGVGYDRGVGYESYISLDVEGDMYGNNGSCYLRIPFDLSSTQRSGVLSLVLRVRYDDGYIAWLNGVEVARKNFNGTPQWNSEASTTHSDTAAKIFEDVDITTYSGYLRTGENILAIQALNRGSTNIDFLISAQLEAVIGSGGGSSLTFDETTQVKARVLGSEWSALTEAVFAVGPVAENLRITEIMYRPKDTNDPDDPNEEYIELTNIGAESININLVRFTDGVDFTFPKMDLAPGQYALIVRDIDAFTAQYGSAAGVVGQYEGSLNNGGERITLEDAGGQIIHSFRFRDGWYDITDGEGFSLTVRDPQTAEPNSYGEKDTWRASALVGGSPGWDDTGVVPEPGSVVINEVLAHSHAEAPDWIELHNTTGDAINIGGWYLSDNDSDDPNRMKYRIPDGTSIAANGFAVFYENTQFNNPSNPDALIPFALSENGDEVVLSSAQDDVLTGYRNREDFDASPTGIAFGRYYKASTDTYNFVLMSENTPDAANAYPLVGPIVINEIMYNPAGGNQDAEYIELLNVTSSPVTLYDYTTAEPWKFTDGIEYTFDSTSPLTVPAGGFVLVVKDAAAFTATYGSAPSGVPVLTYESGNLDNGGEKLEISMPGDVDEMLIRQYIRIDRVNYSDGSHPIGEDLWPIEPDGTGKSLSRIAPTNYGNDVANWKAETPSPGLPDP